VFIMNFAHLHASIASHWIIDLVRCFHWAVHCWKHWWS